MLFKKTLLIFLTSIVCLSLFGCIKPYTVKVQQGNVLDKESMRKLHLGLTKDEVESFLGRPILHGADLTADHWIYVYTNEKDAKKIETRRVELWFKSDKLVKWQEK